MKVFLDTNVIMEYLCNRLNYRYAKDIMDAAYIKGYEACMSSGCKDLEDSYQYYCAIENQCDLIVTFNTKHFVGKHNADIAIWSPDKFVDKYIIH